MKFLVRTNQTIQAQYSTELSLKEGIIVEVHQVASEMLLVSHPIFGRGWIPKKSISPYSLTDISTHFLDDILEIIDSKLESRREQLGQDIRSFKSSSLRNVSSCRKQSLCTQIRNFDRKKLNPQTSLRSLLTDIESFDKSQLQSVERTCRSLLEQIRTFNTNSLKKGIKAESSYLRQIRNFNMDHLNPTQTVEKSLADQLRVISKGKKNHYDILKEIEAFEKSHLSSVTPPVSKEEDTEISDMTAILSLLQTITHRLGQIEQQ